jgi:heat shock protein HslJ
MTDEQMHARLRDAGERWRAASTSVMETDEPHEITVGPASRFARRRWVTALSAAVVAAAVVLGGALALRHDDSGRGHHLAEASSGVTGVDWKPVEVTTRDWPKLPVDQGSLHVGTDGRITWNDGCNSRGGQVRVTATTLTVSDVGGTEVHCSGDPVVDALGAMLTGTVTYSIHQHELTLRKPGVGRIVFEDAANLAAPDPAELRAHPWTLTETETSYSSGNSGGGSASPAVSLSRVTFAGNGTFAVEHHCYTDKGDVAIHDATLTLTHVNPATAIPCASNAESAAGQKENDVVDRLLTGSVTWQIAAGVLTLTKGNDSATFATPASTGQGALVATPWTLTTIDHGTGPSSSSSSPSARVTFAFTEGGATSGHLSSTAKFDDTSIALGGWTNDPGTAPGPELDAADASFVFEHVLVGEVGYRIHGDTLTITRPGVGALVLTKS